MSIPSDNVLIPFVRKFKVVLLGEQSVGKSSLITRFMYDSFDQNYQATIGVDFLSKTMHQDSQSIRLQLWDTAGQERFRALIPSYIRDSQVAIIVYDVTNVYSFNQVPKWVNDVRNERDGESAVIVLVGNKVDVENEERVVSYEDGQSRAKEVKADVFMETSAKSGFNVKKLFRRIVEILAGELSSFRDSGEEDELYRNISLKNQIVTEPPKTECSC